MSDVVQERKDDVRKVREFLYVDHERIRSYYSQINRGVIESVLSRKEGGIQGEVGARLFGFGPSVSADRNTIREESRSLQDLNYVIFEELFEREGLIHNVTEDADRLETWQANDLHASLSEGQIIKYEGNIQIIDPDFVKNRFAQFGQMITALIATQVGPQEEEKGTPPSRQGGRTQPGRKARSPEEIRQRVIAEQVAAIAGGISLAQVASMGEFVGAFTNNSIAARILPFEANPEYHFAGTLLSRNEYIQPEREALFSRYGTHLQDWTIVMQVARIPPSEPSPSPDFSEPLVSGDALLRGSFESALARLMGYMEVLGVAEGARYPAISVTILAIYREFA